MSGDDPRTRWHSLGAVLAIVVAGLLACVIAVGCASSKPSANGAGAASPATAKADDIPINNEALDPCADRLHELTGMLLLYYGAHGKLPAKLEDAAILSAHGTELLNCPVTHLPYVYDPKGPIVTAGGKARLVVYDATPAHHGMRYGIVIVEPTSAATHISAEVKEVPEALFKKN